LGGIDELVSTADIQGVVADGVQRTLAAKALAQRPGALLPLVSAQDPGESFCVEKTVTVNSTASGGNAALLAKV
ncbi:MAG: hypothetical protein AAFR82_12325, partial [Pseudomonadota bacterium]